MKQFYYLAISLLLFSTISFGQSFQRNTAPHQHSLIDTGYLNFFTINDTTKYFEFFTHYMSHGDLECGILMKSAGRVYTVKYADGSDFDRFGLLFKDSTVEVINVQNKGYKAFNLLGIFILQNCFPKQNAYSFPLNYKVFYKAKKDATIKAYEYPSFEAKYKMISFKKGDIIEEKWHVGSYPNFFDIDPIENKCWAIYMYGNNNRHDWFLLSDISNYFEFIKKKNSN